MKKKRSGSALKTQVEEKKLKVTVKHETSEDEESESEEEEETQLVEEEEEEEVEVEEEEEDEEEEEEEEEEDDDDDDDDDESSKKETLKKLLEPLPKEKIIEFLKEAALNDPSILSTLTETAEVDPAHRKIFVYGLGWDATSDQVLSVFKPFGQIEECKVVIDKITGKAKGYGFVLFKSRKSAQKSLKLTQKKIGSRIASCQLASAGPAGPTSTATSSDPNGRKIFVANVGSHVNPNTLRSYFSKFGEIEDGPLGMDNATGKFKGFAMFVYKTIDGSRKALEEPNKVFDGCRLECRQAVEGQRGNKNNKKMQMGNVQQSEIGNVGYVGVYAPQIMNMVGGNPMFGYRVNTVGSNMVAGYGSQLGLPGHGGYQSNYPQVGRSTGGTTPALPARQQPGVGSLGANFPSYLGR